MNTVSSSTVTDFMVWLTIRVKEVTDTLKQVSLHEGKGRTTHPGTGVLGVHIQDDSMVAP